MPLLLDMDGLKNRVRRLEFDLGIANDNLQYLGDQNERLLGLIEDLKTKVSVTRTVGASHAQDNVSGVTLSMQPVDVLEVDDTEENIFELMDAVTGVCMDICEIHGMSYKLKWHTPDCKSRSIWIYHDPDAQMILEAGKKHTAVNHAD